jgi:hypothetical protein
MPLYDSIKGLVLEQERKNYHGLHSGKIFIER